MEHVYVKESNKEVWVDLGRNVGDRLIALDEAQKAIGREVLREKSNRDRNIYRTDGSDQL